MPSLRRSISHWTLRFSVIGLVALVGLAAGPAPAQSEDSGLGCQQDFNSHCYCTWIHACNWAETCKGKTGTECQA